MARKRKDDLAQAIEAALAPGAFIGYRDNGSSADDVEAVRAKIAPLIRKGEAAGAVALLETFIAGCYEKSEEIDDSSGSFWQVADSMPHSTLARSQGNIRAAVREHLAHWMCLDPR